MTSPTAIGPSPGRLSDGINLRETNESRDSVFYIFSKQSRSTNILRNSDDAVSNEHEFRIFLQLSVSRLDGLDSPFINIAAFIIMDSSTSSYNICRSSPGEVF